MKNNKNIKMGDGVVISAGDIAKRLFEDNPAIQEKVRTRLTAYSKNTDNEFLEKLTGFNSKEREGHTATDRKDKNKRLFKNEEPQLCFINNLMNLYWFFTPKDAKDIVMNKINSVTLKKKFNDRMSELIFFATMYDQYVKRETAIQEKLLNDPDFVKENIFAIDGNNSSTTPVARDGTVNKLMKINFSGLSQLEEIKSLEEEDILSESQLMAKKAILYMDMENQKLALQCANNALETDPENGIAWMVKGLILIHDKEYNRGFRTYRKYQMKESDDSNISTLLLKAWKFLPSTLKEMRPFAGYTSTQVYPYHPIYNEKYLIRSFILSAKEFNARLFHDKDTDKEVFLDLLKRDFDKLSFTDEILRPYYFMKLLPLIHEVAPEVERCFAKQWVDSILSVNPTSDLLRDNKIKVSIGELSEDRIFLTKLSSVLSFNEVISLSKHMHNLFTEFERQGHLEYFSNLCWKELEKNNDNVLTQLNICDSALKSFPFKKTNIDNSILKKWNYLKLRLIAGQSFEYMNNEDWNGLASFFVENIDTSLLEHAAELDFHDILWPRSHWKQEEVWFKLIQGFELDMNVRPDPLHDVQCLKQCELSALKGNSLLSYLLNEVLNNILDESDLTTNLKKFKSKCDQLWQNF
ncbi:MAG: hypothetical protein COA61_001730 [Zetaproteobacteria bacterium]|nr:hypothetical protein [Zetaproteobacteria bacterium]